MTILDTNFEWPKAIPGFSCLKMKQELQERIYRATEGMTDEEVREYIQQGAARFDEEQKQLRAELAQRQHELVMK